MASDLKKYQRVNVARERGTEAPAFVLGVLETGEVLVEIDGRMELVNREDITT